jgi:hypothetical protein
MTTAATFLHKYFLLISTDENFANFYSLGRTEGSSKGGELTNFRDTLIIYSDYCRPRPNPSKKTTFFGLSDTAYLIYPPLLPLLESVPSFAT